MKTPLSITVSFLLAALNGGFTAATAEEPSTPPVTVVAMQTTPAIPAVKPTRQLEESELNTMLTATLQRESVKGKGALELCFTRTWTPITVPDEPLNMRILDIPTMGVSANFIVRFQLATHRETLGTWQMTVHAQIWRDVPVTRVPLKRGMLLTEADFALERRDILSLHEAVWDGSTAGPVLEMAEGIQAGSVLYNRAVTMRPVIRRGQTVHAMFQEGTMTIGLKVEALEDGVPGQQVRVRNTQSRRELRGKVQDEQTILVFM